METSQTYLQFLYMMCNLGLGSLAKANLGFTCRRKMLLPIIIIKLLIFIWLQYVGCFCGYKTSNFTKAPQWKDQDPWLSSYLVFSLVSPSFSSFQKYLMQIRFLLPLISLFLLRLKIDSFKEIKDNFQMYPKLIICRLSYTLY